MIRLLHFFLFKRIVFTGPLHQGQCQFVLAVLTLEYHDGRSINCQFTNKLKSNKLIN